MASVVGVTGDRPIATPRVLVSAMAEPREPWQTEVCHLFASLRVLGGSLSQARSTVLFTSSPDPSVRNALEALDVEVRLVTPVDPRCPHANKIRMLEQDDDVDWILALDTDMLITGDLSADLQMPVLRLRVVDADPFTRRQWRRLYDHFQVARPDARLRTTCTGQKTPSYFNSGAVFVPRSLAQQLASTWQHFVGAVLASYDELGDIVEHSFYTDQLALALTLAASGLPLEPLPIEVNTPTHAPINRRWHPASVVPRLVHYHHNVDHAGLVLGSGYSGIDTQIDQANAAWLRKNGGLRP